MQSNQMIPDTDLISGCIAGDRRMQKALYDKYAGKMYAVCLRYMGNADDAQPASNTIPATHASAGLNSLAIRPPEPCFPTR